ncbi:recombinase RecA [Mycoplasma sp. SG1]|uniref:recombinase RecA n=1 Tax=Mycoplasma sp. SG1 TaxID=2810348 RepID=UPI002025522E|nr:DNA recombination/repair protein RecA [Mycoplasma sp. SG1]URM53129.1 DNA recombination/repair protein RecA [Mycoplasma sp. SG1]
MKTQNKNLYDQSLNQLINSINKSYGENTLFSHGMETDNIPVFPSGSLIIDKLIGVDGYPINKIIEIFGPEGSGKTTIALMAIKSAQNYFDKKVVFIDAEHALDIKYARKIGLSVDDLILSQPGSGDDAINIIEQMILSNLFSLIVVDSVAALVPKSEIDGVNEHGLASHARMMSQGLRKINSALSKSDTSIIFLNQVRDKVGILFGPKETTTGGRALKFFASLRIEVRRESYIKDNNGQNIGIKSKIKIVKNKVAPPFNYDFISIYFNSGFMKELEIIEYAIKK